MPLTDLQKIHHLYLRAGFGLTPVELQQKSSLRISTAVDELFQASTAIEYLKHVDPDPTKEEIKRMPKSRRKELRKEARRKTQELPVVWLQAMAKTNTPLREKMSLFWHNHFSTRLQSPGNVQQLNNTIRKHALGDFKALLLAVSKEPVMLRFLNNQQNKKSHPNENFAREVMELFTLGRGHYSEQDIKEAARAFTGWAYDGNYQFTVRQKHHDTGEKTFLGHTGNWGGEDIIDFLLQEKQTARFICQKLYKDMVNDQVNAKHVEELATVFYDAEYDIEKMLRHLFTADWFYAPENRGVKVKSPVELMVGINRMFEVTYEDPKVLFMLSKLLGQVLFFPPNVAGWPGGRQWIDSSSLLLRLKLPSAVLNNGVVEYEMKEEAEVQMTMNAAAKQKGKLKRLMNTQVSWERINRDFSQLPETMSLQEYLLPSGASQQAQNLIQKLKEGDLQAQILQYLTLPEFQLC